MQPELQPSPPEIVHPVVGPPDDSEIYAPIRDDHQLTPSEDLDREPDGVPHKVVGMTAFFVVMVAMLVAVMLYTGGVYIAIAIAVIAIPTFIAALNRRAKRTRDRVHPSR